MDVQIELLKKKLDDEIKAKESLEKDNKRLEEKLNEYAPQTILEDTQIIVDALRSENKKIQEERDKLKV